MQPFKIVLIDDSEWELYFHQELLLLNGIEDELTSFLEAKEALKYLSNLNANAARHIILCDIHMPLMNGFEFADQINNLPFLIREKIEVYFLSSTLDNSELQKAKNYKGVNALFSKPLDVPAFKNKINFVPDASLTAY